MEGHPYLRLLRAYLDEFLPREGCEGAPAAPTTGGVRQAAGMPRQLTVRAAPGGQLHGNGAQVGGHCRAYFCNQPLPCCRLPVRSHLRLSSLLYIRSMGRFWALHKALRSRLQWAMRSDQTWDRMSGQMPLRGLSVFFIAHCQLHAGGGEACPPHLQSQLLLSIFMEFWLSDGDCPLPVSGERSVPDTPKTPVDAWQDFNDAWGGLLAAPQASLR